MMKILLRYRSLGIQGRLSMLAAATALPLVVLAGFAILQMVEDQRIRIQQDVENQVKNLLWDVDRQIGAVQAELQVLAVSPSLQDGDFAAFDRQMRATLKISGTSIVLHDTKGQRNFSARTGRLASRFLALPIPKCMTASLQRVSLRFPT